MWRYSKTGCTATLLHDFFHSGEPLNRTCLMGTNNLNTYSTDCMSLLAWEHLGIPQNELSIFGERNIQLPVMGAWSWDDYGPFHLVLWLHNPLSATCHCLGIRVSEWNSANILNVNSLQLELLTARSSSESSSSELYSLGKKFDWLIASETMLQSVKIWNSSS